MATRLAHLEACGPVRSDAPSATAPRGAALALLGCVLVATACRPPGGQPGDATDAAVAVVARPVLTEKVGRGDMQDVLRAASTIEAERSVTIHAESMGRITSLSAEEGDAVKPGQVLAVVKFDAQANSLARAENNLEQAEANYQRTQQLFSQKAVGEEELDRLRIAFETAKIDLSDRKRELKNTRVTSPLAGTLTERKVSLGAYVTAGQQLFSVVDFDSLVARVYVPEKQLDRVRVGQTALVSAKALSGREGEGTILRVAPVVDAATGTVKVTVGLPRDLVGGDRGFLPGMYAEVVLATATHQGVLVVPKSAIVKEGELPYLMVVEGHEATRARVELGLEESDRVEVLSGVSEGAEIVVAGQSGLKDGALVRRVDANGTPLEDDPSPDAAAAGAGGPSAPSAVGDGQASK